jgi:hypothetical protein
MREVVCRYIRQAVFGGLRSIFIAEPSFRCQCHWSTSLVIRATPRSGSARYCEVSRAASPSVGALSFPDGLIEKGAAAMVKGGDPSHRRLGLEGSRSVTTKSTKTWPLGCS